MNIFATILAEFLAQVDPARAQVVHLPLLVFVFGRHLRNDPNAAPSGMRDMFVTWAHETDHKIAQFLRLPEDYPEWNQFIGYDDLVQFETDAGCISRAILLFVESEGAFAELGAFCKEPVLAERLFVVLYSKFYHTDSYIALGPLRVLQRVQGDEHSICPVEGDKLEDFQKVLPELADDVLEKAQQGRTHIFDPEQIRDQFLFIADVVELFGALKISEIIDLLTKFNMPLDKARVKQMLSLLCLLEVVQLSEHLSRRFYVPPKGKREAFIGYKIPDSDARLDRLQFKLRALEFLKSDSFRRQAYEKVHGRL